jgi:hypothetical protein
MEITAPSTHAPWNKGKLVGQKAPFKLKEIRAIRIQLQLAHRCRDLALFNLAVDSKLRACDLMNLEPARTAVAAWIAHSKRRPEDFLFPSRRCANSRSAT